MNNTEDQRSASSLGPYSLHVRPDGVIIREEGAPVSEAIMIYPFVALAPIVGSVAVYVAVFLGWAGLSPSEDFPAWLGVLLFFVFGAGAAICFWVFRTICTRVFPGTHRIEEGGCGLVCRSWVLGIRWRRRCMERPLEVIAEVYQVGGDWMTRVCLQDTKKRRFPVVVATTLASSRDATSRQIKPFAEALADALGCTCVVG